MEKWRLGGSGGPSDPKMIPTRFSQSIDREAGKLNSLKSGEKVVAAITKALSMQGESDGNNYYIDGDQLYCPSVTVLDTDDEEKKLYSASGRVQVGRVQNGSDVSNMMIEFDIRFQDSEDEMGLPDLHITEATLDEIDRTAPLNPEGV